jgi:hypothetical protein
MSITSSSDSAFNPVQLLQIYIASCPSPSSLSQFVVQIPSAESVKVVLEPSRWVATNGQHSCLPVYIPVNEQLTVIAIELWQAHSSSPSAVSPVQLTNLRIGDTITHSINWIDIDNIKQCDIVIGKVESTSQLLTGLMYCFRLEYFLRTGSLNHFLSQN